MPQLNPEFFSSQVFWLIVTFSFLLFFMWKVSLPRISSVLEKRKNKINGDIQTAKKLQTEAEKIQVNIDQLLYKTRDQVAQLLKEKTNILQQNMSTQLQKIDKELVQYIDDATITIEKNKQDTLENIKIQIHEITKLTLAKLININISDKEIHDSIGTIQNKKSN